MKLLRAAVCCLLVSLSVSMRISAEQADVQAASGTALTFSEQSEGSYRYEFDDGAGFESNVRLDEQSAMLAVLEFDSGLSWTAEADGQKFIYSSGQILDTPGNYVFFIRNQAREARFSFSVGSFTQQEQLENLLSSGDETPDFTAGFLKSADLAENAPPEIGWDQQNKRYSYRFPNGVAFYATVPNGAITTQAFRIFFPEEISANLLFNGSGTAYQSGDELSTPGVYCFQILVLPRLTGEQYQIDTYSCNYFVYVAGAQERGLRIVNPPESFTLAKASLNGNELKPDGNGTVVLRRDGRYQFEFAGPQGVAGYRTELLLDTTPPLLSFTNDAGSGFASGTACYEKQDESDHISIQRNGSPYPERGLLGDNGFYTLTVTDSAGNSRQYTVRVDHVSARRVDVPILILAVLALAAFGGYLLYVRRHARVI